MRRVTLLFLVLATIALPQTILPDDSDLTRRIISFNNPYGQFVRKYFGCPPQAHEFEECRPITGGMDYKLYNHAREAAKKLFGLAEPTKQ